MSQKLQGYLKGLAPAQKRQVERLYTRRIGVDELAPLEFGRELSQAAQDLSRIVGVLVSREGSIESVIVGKRDILYLPDLGRYRLGQGRLRRLRLIVSDITKPARPARISSDIYVDLEKLRLDCVVAVKPFKNQLSAAYAYNLPFVDQNTATVQTEEVRDLGALELDFEDFIRDLEDQHAQKQITSLSTGPNPAVLVGVYDQGEKRAQQSMAELEELAETAGVSVVESVSQFRRPDPKTLVGKGKLEEIVLLCLRTGADLIIFDAELKPSQWRAITNSTDLKIIDRSMLILDIFSQHASSSDGRLQVELAQLKYNLPRLVEKDAGLSRLTGGIGGRGPGETKLEIGRRRMRDRINQLEKQIDRLSSQRQLKRDNQLKNQVTRVSILGYTNAGKSTLFNALTKSDVIVEDKLFATLDPAQRKLYVNGGDSYRQVLISDTVGFIRELPEELVNAFRATLEELTGSSLLLHVLDASDPLVDEKKDSVERVVSELGLSDLPVVVALNKSDMLTKDDIRTLEREHQGIGISATKREGLNELRTAIGEALRSS